MPPAEDLGGGASITLRHPALGAAGGIRLFGFATNSGFSECSGENGGTGVTAGSVPRMRQQAGIILIPCIVKPCAISPQQEGRALACIVSTQADAGSAVHKSTAASMSNATFLPQCIIGMSQVPTLSIHLGVAGVCVHDHTPENLRIVTLATLLSSFSSKDVLCRLREACSSLRNSLSTPSTTRIDTA
jgi:hypothetical protein